ncbi:MAG: divalent metal cation transporter [Myxococcota bacterium]
MTKSGWAASLGPGLLFAATAVGVSHLVQATRAGAEAGLGLVGWILLALIVKYPAFRFGAHRPAVTGTSLLQGYRELGRWALVLYAGVTLATMFTVQAAVTLVTAGLVLAAFDVRASPGLVGTFVLVAATLVLVAGKYQGLRRITGVLVAALSLTTLIVAAAVLPKVDLSTLGPGVPSPVPLAFLVALVGWMPSGPDVSVWHSLWVLEAGRSSGAALEPRQVLRDFDVGYAGTALLALSFVVLGAGLLYGRPPLPGSAGGFSRGLISVYADVMGAGFRPVIALCAVAAMASTTLAVLDGFPRALSRLWLRFGSDENELEETTGRAERAYWFALTALVVGSAIILNLFFSSLRGLVDLATTLSFLTAPVLCFLNHRAVFSPSLPPEKQPSSGLRWASLASVALQIMFALVFLVVSRGTS